MKKIIFIVVVCVLVIGFIVGIMSLTCKAVNRSEFRTESLAVESLGLNSDDIFWFTMEPIGYNENGNLVILLDAYDAKD